MAVEFLLAGVGRDWHPAAAAHQGWHDRWWSLLAPAAPADFETLRSRQNERAQHLRLLGSPADGGSKGTSPSV